jgi:hypothetical protein
MDNNIPTTPTLAIAAKTIARVGTVNSCLRTQTTEWSLAIAPIGVFEIARSREEIEETSIVLCIWRVAW